MVAKSDVFENTMIDFYKVLNASVDGIEIDAETTAANALPSSLA